MSHTGYEDRWIQENIFGTYESLQDAYILDAGCGQGKTGFNIKSIWSFEKGNPILYGYDVFPKYVQHCNKLGFYDWLEVRDISKPWIGVPVKHFDIIVCQHVIEHLEKEDALRVLKTFELYAKDLILITTPSNFTPSDKEYHDNQANEHKSEWSREDFEELGYKTNLQVVRPWSSRVVDSFAKIYYKLKTGKYPQPSTKGVIVAWKKLSTE